MKLRQLLHREEGLADAAAGDLISLHRRRRIFEQQREPAALRIECCDMALGERSTQPRRQLPIEANLPLIDAKPDTGGAAAVVLRCRLEHHAARTAVDLRGVVDD